MTSFGDVNVGDKVRLTHNEFVDLEDAFRVDATREGQLRSAYRGWYDEDAWSLEVLEPAPKPLPDVDAVYTVSDAGLADGPLVFTRYRGEWKCNWRTDPDESEALARMHHQRAGLIALVPSTAVEEARAEVVKEIVKWLRSVGSTYWADRVKNKFGGKA